MKEVYAWRECVSINNPPQDVGRGYSDKKTAMRLKGCDVTQGLIGGVMSTGTAVSGGAGAGRRRDVHGSLGNGGMATLMLLALFVVPVVCSPIDHIIELA